MVDPLLSTTLRCFKSSPTASVALDPRPSPSRSNVPPPRSWNAASYRIMATKSPRPRDSRPVTRPPEAKLGRRRLVRRVHAPVRRAVDRRRRRCWTTDIQASIVMGRIRSGVNAPTRFSISFPRTRSCLNSSTARSTHFEIGTIATVACAVTASPYDTLTVALAGHPPPVIAVPGRPASFAETIVSPPIGFGFGAERPRAATTISVGAGTVMAFYTDGLIERRGESLDRGLERLRQAVSAEAPPQVARDIMRQCIGGSVPGDDIALVVMRRSASTDTAP